MRVILVGPEENWIKYADVYFKSWSDALHLWYHSCVSHSIILMLGDLKGKEEDFLNILFNTQNIAQPVTIFKKSNVFLSQFLIDSGFSVTQVEDNVERWIKIYYA